jgi:hypothetical protein
VVTGSHLSTTSLMSTSPTATPPSSPHQPAPFATFVALTTALLLCLFHLRSLQTPHPRCSFHFNTLQPRGLRDG